MGMFDEIKCDAPLPDAKCSRDSLFQTKSLYNSMDYFTITAGGRLIFHEHHRELIDKSGLRYKLIHVADIDMEYHGDVEFYGVAMDGGAPATSADSPTAISNGFGPTTRCPRSIRPGLTTAGRLHAQVPGPPPRGVPNSEIRSVPRVVEKDTTAGDVPTL